jgi:mRNA interferase RelE/StbE
MESYKIEFSKSAEKELNEIDQKFIARILKKIKSLAVDPFSISKRLVARAGYRLRVGDYRVIFDIFEDEKLIFISKIAHRKDVYRK